MSRIFVVPQPGRTVPDPERGDVLPDAGRLVPKSQYWMRRVGDKDVAIRTASVKVKETSDAR